MTDDDQNGDYLPFHINYFPNQMLETKEEDSTVAIVGKNNSLQQLKKLLKGQLVSKDVDFEDDFLKAYLIHCKHDSRRAFEKLQNYLNFRKNHIYFYQNVEIDLEPQPSWEFAFFLPRRLPDGSVIVLLEPGNWDPEALPFETAKQIFYMIFQQELRNPVTQASGFHVIVDFSNIRICHYKYCTPYNGYLLKQAAFDVLPGNFSGTHFINSNFMVVSLLNLSKPFIPEYFRNQIYIHSSPDKLLDYFPESVLPAKFGGAMNKYDSEMPAFLRNAKEQHRNFPIGGQANIF